uniref:Uncharacterized protein n=1 Tax=Anguilla anguilla TaxID=7936 RepID=A0A0E9TCL7_ANGAN
MPQDLAAAATIFSNRWQPHSIFLILNQYKQPVFLWRRRFAPYSNTVYLQT